MIRLSPNFSVSSACVNNSISFIDGASSSSSGQAIIDWYWDFGDGSAINNDQNPNHVFTIAGTYNVQQVVFDGLCYDTVVNPVVISPSDIASITYPQVDYCITASNPSAIISGLTGGVFAIDNGGSY